MSSSPIWGYATRSHKSACIMRAVDLLNPFKRHVPLAWGQRNLAASLAGLGDLILHLPLLSALALRAQERDITLDIALRPDHAEIGRRLGWPVISLENPLQSLFNGKANASQHLVTWAHGIQELRKHRYDLCLDLGGSAFNAVLFKRGHVARLASRTTRGGGSLIEHVLEHQPFENEYSYRDRLARQLEINPDFSVYTRMVPSPQSREEVILALTTSCRWRNWPLRNFCEVIEAFPDQNFTLVGHADEILDKDRADFARMAAFPRVENLLGKLSTLELIERIASARAIICNDSSAAHIANAFHIPGMVLFGPEDSATWAKPGGLDVLHDKSCPYFPCVQWHCKNQTNWCMEKIRPADVILQMGQCLSTRL